MRIPRILAPALIALALLSLGAAHAFAATPPPPASDPFYKPPSDYARFPLGAVLRARAVSIGAFGDAPEKVSSWQLLYRTENTQGKSEATVATVLVPQTAWAGGPRPLVSYQEAEDSLGTQCAP
jgi:hypothetical protein